MFRSHQFATASLAVITLGSMTAAAEEGRNESGQVVIITDLQPFIHVAYIPAGVSLPSIKMLGIKAVTVTSQRRSVTEERYCNQPWSEPGGSILCQSVTETTPVPAYRITYSYRGQAMASDEYGNTYFTFNVYFRPGEMSPALLEVLSSGKTEGSAVEGFFELSTAQESTQLLAVDQANSTFCEGNYVDGNWVRTNPKCEDRI